MSCDVGRNGQQELGRSEYSRVPSRGHNLGLSRFANLNSIENVAPIKPSISTLPTLFSWLSQSSVHGPSRKAASESTSNGDASTLNISNRNSLSVRPYATAMIPVSRTSVAQNLSVTRYATSASSKGALRVSCIQTQTLLRPNLTGAIAAAADSLPASIPHHSEASVKVATILYASPLPTRTPLVVPKTNMSYIQIAIVYLGP